MVLEALTDLVWFDFGCCVVFQCLKAGSHVALTGFEFLVLLSLDTGIIDMSHHVYCHNFCLQVIILCAGWSHWLSSCLSLFALCLSSGCESFTGLPSSAPHLCIHCSGDRAARVTSPGHFTPQLSLVLSNTVTLFHCLFKTGSNEAAGAGLHRRAWPQTPTLSEGWVIYSSVPPFLHEIFYLVAYKAK